MHRLILASAALLAVSGPALAQEAPALIYSDSFAQNVQNVGNGAGLDYTGTASVARDSYGTATASQFDVNQNQNYSGK